MLDIQRLTLKIPIINYVRNYVRHLGIGKSILHMNRWIRQKYYYECIWHLKTKQKYLYLTFDDGPNPESTLFILHELKKHNAKATFFCIGRNVESHYMIYKKIIEEGHSVGNHTYDHLDGLETNTETYMDNISKAQSLINSNLFRPPYGNITKSQLRKLRTEKHNLTPIMWSVSSRDFDLKNVSVEECYSLVTKQSTNGSIILFHDLPLTMGRLRLVLPRILNDFKQKGFQFKKIDYNKLSKYVP